MGMPPVARLRHSLGLIHIALNMLWEMDRGRKGKLSPAGIEILYTAHFSKVRMSDVASMLRVSKSTATDLINYLEREGYVNRARDADDRRTLYITPAEKGEEWILSVEGRLFGYLEQRLSYLTFDEQEQLADLCAKFSGVFDDQSFMAQVQQLRKTRSVTVPLTEHHDGRLLRLEEVAGKRYGSAAAASQFHGSETMFTTRKPETEEGIQDEITVEQYDIMQKNLCDAGHLPLDSLIRSGICAGTALEIGPGPGYYGLEWLKANPGTWLIGVEISPAMIRCAEKKAAAYGLSGRARYHLGNAMALPLDKTSVDAVFSNGSLHEWEDAGAVFDEIARVIKPGGRFCITDLRRDLSREIYQDMYKSCKPPGIRPGFESSVRASYTKNEIEDILAGSRLTGWTVIAHPYGLAIAGRII